MCAVGRLDLAPSVPPRSAILLVHWLSDPDACGDDGGGGTAGVGAAAGAGLRPPPQTKCQPQLARPPRAGPGNTGCPAAEFSDNQDSQIDDLRRAFDSRPWKYPLAKNFNVPNLKLNLYTLCFYTEILNSKRCVLLNRRCRIK